MAEAGSRWPRAVGCSKARLVSHLPLAEDWIPVARAIGSGWNVMLVWDAARAEWRCDFLREGALRSGEGLWLGQAAAEAWEGA